MSVITQEVGTHTILAVTALQSLANSAAVGWKSARISNLATKALDYEIFVKLTTANSAPANDKCVRVLICPWYYDATNDTWYSTDGGTGTLPTDGDASYTIADPNNLLPGKTLSYTTQQQVMQATFNLSSCFGGNSIPDGFSLIVVNYSGANLSTGCIVDAKPIGMAVA